MKKATTFTLLFATVLFIAGCAQKSESEKLRDEMNDAGKQMNKEMKSTFGS